MNERNPPRLFHKFFRWFCHRDMLDHIEGDLLELYDERVRKSGKRRADIKFVFDVLLLCRPGIIKPSEPVPSLNEYDMFRNYFKVGIRNILKYKVFSFINVFGLALAMSICMLIILMLGDQVRFDAFHKNTDRIYRILSSTSEGRQPYATSPYPLASALKSEYTVSEETVNLTPGVGGDATNGQKLTELRGYFADPSFFKVFSFSLDNGDATTALVQPNTIVISIEAAQKLFGTEDPIGKPIEFSDRQLSFPIAFDGTGAPAVPWGTFTVTGVINMNQYKSHLKFDALMSSASRQALYADKKLTDRSNTWEWYYRTYTYSLLKEGRSESDLNVALQDLVKRKYAEIDTEDTKGFKLTPQKLSDVQLGLVGNDTNNRLPKIGYYFLGGLAFIIMLLACLNYTNLSVARALTRAKEIGVRKVTGATRKSLISQFLSESVITAFLALVMAVTFLTIIRPSFKGLWVNQYLEFELPMTPSVLIAFAGLASFIGITAGLYPALYLSSSQPVASLKSLQSIRPGKLGMRKVLSITQFVVSLFFITSAILIFNQFKHFANFDYGFQPKNIVNIDLQGADYQRLSHELSTLSEVTSIAACDIIPAGGGNNGMEIKKEGSEGAYTRTDIMNADENFISTLGLKLVAGKNFEETGDSNRFVLVNEFAVKKLGYSQPSEIIGQEYESKYNQEPLTVIGVVKDFRYKLLINANEVGALVLRNQPSRFKFMNVQFASRDFSGFLAKMKTSWKKIDPAHPFKYEMYSDQLANTHKGIFDAVTIIGFISFLAIVIACLGLLGMATYTAERKAKEVGIRKVMGAENFNIAMMLSGSYLKLLWVSIIIGAPLSYFISNAWLKKFPNRVEFGWVMVAEAATLLFVLGLITIGSQTFRASRRNPVEALKTE